MRNYKQGAIPSTESRTVTFTGLSMSSAPFRYTATQTELDSFPRSSAALETRCSLKNLPNTTFLPAPSLQASLCADIHGDLPFGLYVVQNAFVKGEGAIFYSAQGRLLTEQNAGLLTNEDLLNEIENTACLPNVPTREFTHILSLVSTCTDCFWHWMMDSLPKVFLAEQCGYTGAYLIPHRNAPPSVLESLDLLGIARERLVLHDFATYSARNLYIPTYFSGFNAPFNASFIQQYRERILSRLPSPISTTPERIYVPRKSTAKARRIINSEEVEALVIEHGYKTVYFENLSLREQLTIASHSTAMVAPHGSGMTHMLFMKKRSSIIELFPFQRHGSVDCYERLAPIAQHAYAFLESIQDVGTDIHVDIQALMRLLNTTGVSA